ncbi:MAG: heme exporter protein CcmD [Saccharospirillaceae bacterium]|nr:heme exporter protein CcmD [Saccharospirillaceae bacterium]
MIFESISDAIQMCGQVVTPLGEETRCRGSYVWACYAVGLSVIIYNVLSPILRKKKLLKQEARRRLSERL